MGDDEAGGGMDEVARHGAAANEDQMGVRRSDGGRAAGGAQKPPRPPDPKHGVTKRAEGARLPRPRVAPGRLVRLALWLALLAWATSGVLAGRPWAAAVWVVLVAFVAWELQTYVSKKALAFISIVVAAAGIVPLIPTQRDAEPNGSSPPSAAAASPAAEDLAAPLRVTRTRVGDEPFAVSFAAGSFWIANYASDSVSQLEPSGAVVRTVSVPDRPAAITQGLGSVWVSSNGAASVSRIDAETGLVSWSRPVGVAPAGLVVEGGSVWVCDAVDDAVLRLDPADGRTTGRIAVPAHPISVVTGGGALWVISTGGTVSRLDAASGRVVKSTALPNDLMDAVFAGGGLWLTAPSENRLLRLDADSLAVTDSLVVGALPTGVDADDQSIWVTSTNDNILTRVDAGSRKVSATIRVGAQPIAVATSDDALVVAEQKTGMASVIVKASVPAANRAVPVLTSVRVGSAPVGMASGLLHEQVTGWVRQPERPVWARWSRIRWA